MILNHKIKIIIHIYHQLLANLAYSDHTINYVRTKLKATYAYELFHSKAVSTLYIVHQVQQMTLCSLSALTVSQSYCHLICFFLASRLSINPAILSRSTGEAEGSAVLNFRNRR